MTPMYLFFDIDGVLNKESMWKMNYSLDKGMVNRFCGVVSEAPGIAGYYVIVENRIYRIYVR